MDVLPGDAARATRLQARNASRQWFARTEQRERLLGKTLSAIIDLAYAFDRRGRILYANQPALDLWGVTSDEVVGKTPTSLGYPEELSRRVAGQVEHVFTTLQTVSDEVAFTARDGVVRFFEYTFFPAIGSDGQVDFGVGFSRDISDRKRADDALRASVAQFHTLAAAMPQIVWTADPQGNVTSLNQRWVDFTGTRVGQLLGRPWSDVLMDHGAQVRPAWFETALAAGEDFAQEICLRGKDGRSRWWLMRGVPLPEPGGSAMRWIGTCTDIDELKLAQLEASRANAELRRQRTELRALFDLVPAMIWFKDTRNNFVRANELGARSIGRTVEEVEGRSAEELYPKQAADFFAGDLHVMRTHQPILGKLEHARGADGKQRWFQKDKVPVHNDAGEVVGLVVMSMDITDRKRDQDALRELNADLEARVRDRTAELALARDAADRANQAKSTFLATMSHELRTPLSGMLGLLELLGLTQLDAEQASTLAVVRDSGRTLQRHIDGILDFSKIEADLLELDPAPASVRAIVDGACRLHGHAAASKGLALEQHVDPEVSDSLLVDGLRLGQILNNFLSNAIKFTDRGGVSVTVELVSSAQGRQHLQLSVRDTGIGIAPERMGALFKPFGQASAQTSTRYGGTGLGLFIAKRLAQLMGGDVHLESRWGEGTVLQLQVGFDVCAADAAMAPPLPAPMCSGVRPHAAVTAEGQGAADTPLLLLVDDHPVNRAVLLRQAATLGYRAEAVEDAFTALQAWSTDRFAAIITDCSMPGMTGCELTQEVRRREAARGQRRIPIIGLTANALPTAVTACRECGMNDAIIKPADLRAIRDTLQRWVPIERATDPAARCAASDDDGLLDLSVVEAICAGQEPGHDSVLQQFRCSIDEDGSAMQRAARKGDFGGMARHAHRLRGACGVLGARKLSQACANVQSAAASADPASEVGARMPQVEAELQRLTAYLDGILRTQPPGR